MPSNRAAALMLLVRGIADSKSANSSPSMDLPRRSIQTRTATSQSADQFEFWDFGEDGFMSCPFALCINAMMRRPVRSDKLSQQISAFDSDP